MAQPVTVLSAKPDNLSWKLQTQLIPASCPVISTCASHTQINKWNKGKKNLIMDHLKYQSENGFSGGFSRKEGAQLEREEGFRKGNSNRRWQGIGPKQKWMKMS